MILKVLVIVKNVKACYTKLIHFELDVYVLIHFETQLTTKLDLVKLGYSQVMTLLTCY